MGLERRRWICAGIALCLIPVGVGWRMLPLHLPFVLYKYGGSMLWAAMVYCIAAALWARWRPISVALVAGAASAAVELSRLFHTPALDAFRTTLAGQLLLGKYFSVHNILAYWLAIAVAATVDASVAGKQKA